MDIGITGSNGVIGEAVSRFLTERNHTVIPLDTLTRLTRVESIADAELPKSLDWVLHFGAKTSIPKSFESPFETYSANINSTLIALRIAAHVKASFLFMSSYVYGEPQYLPLDERHPVVSSNPYMGSKIVCEELCKSLGQTLGIPLVILRGFNIYGKNQMPGRLIPDLIEDARQNRPLSLNDPNPRRDYLYIKDFEELIQKIILRNPLKTGTYNVASGKSHSNLEVAEMVRGIAENTFPLKIKGMPRQNDISDCSVDASLIQETYSWHPKFSLHDGLRELLSGIS